MSELQLGGEVRGRSPALWCCCWRCTLSVSQGLVLAGSVQGWLQPDALLSSGLGPQLLTRAPFWTGCSLVTQSETGLSRLPPFPVLVSARTSLDVSLNLLFLLACPSSSLLLVQTQFSPQHGVCGEVLDGYSCLGSPREALHVPSSLRRGLQRGPLHKSDMERVDERSWVLVDRPLGKLEQLQF